VKLHRLHPDPEPDGPSLQFFGPELVGRGGSLPVGEGEDEVAGGDQILEVPEVVDRLGHQGDLPIIAPEALFKNAHEIPF